jgi:hypothetical protein
LQTQILQVQFFGAFGLLLCLQPLLIAFQNQGPQHRFQRFAVLRKIFGPRVHGVRLL